MDSRPPARGICPLDMDGTRQYGCENEALGRKYSLRADSWISGAPWVRDLITPAISLTGSVLVDYMVRISVVLAIPGFSIVQKAICNSAS
jgi:hypothetical protein